jgi:glutathione S-transferase
MPQIETKNEKIQKLAGLHLYHDLLSSCAMRVRMVLAEKKLPWQSHVIDLATMEHATPEYQSINPNGLVPTLVHDGRTYIESVDIIHYLDELAAEPSLTPVDQKEQSDCRSLTASADGGQVALKTLAHEFLFHGSGRYLGEEDQKKFATAHRNAWLVDFKRSFAARDDKWLAKVAAASWITHNKHLWRQAGKCAIRDKRQSAFF